MKPWLYALTALFACDTPIDTADSDTSGAIDDTADTAEACEVHLIGVTPTDGALGVYYRDPVYLSFDGDAATAVFEVRDPQGVAATLAAEWGPGNTLVTLSGVLTPSTEYTVHVELCGVQTDTHFTTSALGTPLTISPDALIGRTFSFALRDAEITEPPALEILGDASLTTPLGFMVQDADDTVLELLGGVLEYTETDLVQMTNAETWDFPSADFTESPYFHTAIDELTIVYRTETIPKTDIRLYAFEFDGLFSPDGTAIENGRVEALVDTRTLGPLLNLPDAVDSVCVYAEPFAIECIPCPDAEPYCIFMIGEDITAPWVEGLELTPFTGAE